MWQADIRSLLAVSTCEPAAIRHKTDSTLQIQCLEGVSKKIGSASNQVLMAEAGLAVELLS